MNNYKTINGCFQINNQALTAVPIIFTVKIDDSENSGDVKTVVNQTERWESQFADTDILNWVL